MTLPAFFVLLEKVASAFKMNKGLEIYVGNISKLVDQDDLQAAFKDYVFSNMRLLAAGTNKYAFLQLESEDSIRRAMREMNGHCLKGRNIIVRAGDRNVHQRLSKEIEGVPDKQPTGRGNALDEGPPPLETCYFPIAPEDDCPPPLVPAFSEGAALDDDSPPPLVRACLKDKVPPLEEVLPQRLGQELPSVTKAEFQKGRTKDVNLGSTPITLVVANFPFGTTEEDLIWLFKKFTPLKTTVVLNTRIKNETTYAYVTVPDRDLAEQAIFERDDYKFKNRNLMVTYVLERVHHC